MTTFHTSSLRINDDHHECCIDLLHESKNDNNLPLITTTPHMPAIIKTQDRPVVLYMAPIHKQDSDCSCNSNDDATSSNGVQNLRIN